MFRDMTPVGIWRESMNLWCRAATIQMEMTLDMWRAVGESRQRIERRSSSPRLRAVAEQYRAIARRTDGVSEAPPAKLH